MTTIQIVSDIHLEIRKGRIPSFNSILTPSTDILILAGDIGTPLDKSLYLFLKWCSSNFKFVLYVPGNHEYYNDNGLDIITINDILQKICAKFTNVIFLYNKVYTTDRIAFIGSTLWSHIPDQHRHEIKTSINDFKHIYKSPWEVVTPEDINIEYFKNKEFLVQEVGNAYMNQKIPIVITHHTPSFIGTSDPKYDSSNLKYSFSSQLNCEKGIIRLWCCGHTHYNFHHDFEGYELISNQFGYGRNAVAGYNPTLSIMI